MCECSKKSVCTHPSQKRCEDPKNHSTQKINIAGALLYD